MLFLIIPIADNIRYLIGNSNKNRQKSFFTFLLPFRTHLIYSSVMATQEPTAAPDQFVRLLRKSIAAEGLSLREIGRRIGASTAYMSRLVNKQRGLPADETITKMEKTLNLEPGLLFDAAGRHDAILTKLCKNQKTRQLIRELEPLTDEQFDHVLKTIQDLKEKYHPHQQ